MKKALCFIALSVSLGGVHAQGKPKPQPSPEQLNCAPAAAVAESLAKTRSTGNFHPRELAKIEAMSTGMRNLVDVHKKLVAVSEVKPALVVCPQGEVNAFVMESGKYIFVFAGLIERYGREQGWLAAVLAHELGHIARRHFEFRNASVGHLIAQATSAGYGEYYRSGDIEKAKIAAVTTVLGNMSAFSRQQEIDADGYGTVLLSRAGFDPKVMAGLMEQMMFDARGKRSATTWLDSHPGWQERLANVEPRIYDVEADRLARSMQGDRRALARQVNAWLKQMPDSGNAWYHKAAILESLRAPAYLEAYGRALTSESPQMSRSESELGEVWLRLCTGLYREGYKAESAACSRYIKSPELQAQYREATFGGNLFIHGNDNSPQTLVTARVGGSRLITNDPAVLANRGISATQRVAPWRPIRFPPDDVDQALPER